MLFIVLCTLLFIQALIVAAVLTPVARKLGPALGMVDVPNLARKHHAKPIPRSGGLALFTAFWGCLFLNIFLLQTFAASITFLPDSLLQLTQNLNLRLWQLLGIFTGSSIIFALGVLDDSFGLPAKLRLAIQILAAVPLIATGTQLQFFLPDPVAWLLTICWVVFLTNSLNFLDNMNGLTSGISAIMAAVLATHSILAGEWYMAALFALLAGSAVGFWFYNFPTASLFLGDSGSTTLGFLFAALTTVATYYQAELPSQLPVLIPIAVMGVPLFDTLSVMWIRWRSGKPLMQGDTNHFSHRLVALGMSRTQAVLFIYGVTLTVGLAALVLRPLPWHYGILQLFVLILVFVGAYVMERISHQQRKSSTD
ncbi:MAG: MraY family glycosyltransferase [Sumerlaeia bacterium]